MNRALEIVFNVSSVGCNKPVLSAIEGRSALPRMIALMRRNARWLLRPTPTALLFLGLIATPLVQAEELGRLFFTPEQRAQLEHDKVLDTSSGDSHRVLSVNGIVQRHGGERTVWINGVPQAAGTSDEQSPESVPITIPGQLQQVKVKVGQKVIVNTAPAGE